MKKMSDLIGLGGRTVLPGLFCLRGGLRAFRFQRKGGPDCWLDHSHGEHSGSGCNFRFVLAFGYSFGVEFECRHYLCRRDNNQRSSRLEAQPRLKPCT